MDRAAAVHVDRAAVGVHVDRAAAVHVNKK